jgi:hypothetical protein
MKLYHGTNIDFDRIDLSKSNPYKDFGRGFYLTDLEEQACALADKRVSIWGGNKVVQVYEFDESFLLGTYLNVLIFEKPTAIWADFIYKNRSHKGAFTHEYDLVIGPIANDGVAYLLNRYEEGTMTLSELTRKLKYKKLNSQYFFGTQRSVELLKRIS